MNKKVKDLLLSLAIMGDYNFGSYYGCDEKVNECLMSMYFYMLHNNPNDQEKERFFQEFEESYQNLDKEQQKIIKNEYIDIIETQNKNREKVKRKGMIDYE